MIEPPPDDHALRRAVSRGADLATASGAAVAGAAVGGPVGAALGAGLTWAGRELVRGGIEVAARHLTARAEARVGAVFTDVVDEVSARLMAGAIPREDLRETVTPGRTAAAELVEATLLAASKSFEERKLPYLAHLLAAVIFEADLDLADAHQLIAVAESLSYRQLVMLAAFVAVNEEHPPPRPMGGFHLQGAANPYAFPDSGTLASLRVDLLDLFRRGLVDVERERRVRRGTGGASFAEETPWPSIPAETNPDATTVSQSGNQLVRMMRLNDIPRDEQESLVLRHLRWPEESDTA